MERPVRQERLLTLGEILFMEDPAEPPRAPPHRPMGRTMSPSRCLGAVVSGRRRRPRGRTLTRSTTSTNHNVNSSNEPSQNQQSQNRSEHLTPPRHFMDIFLPFLDGVPEPRARNFGFQTNTTQRNRRRATSDHVASRHSNSLLHPHQSSNSAHRRRTAGGFARSRTAANTDIIANLRRHLTLNNRSGQGPSRTNDVYDRRIIRTTSTYQYLPAGSSRNLGEPRGNSSNGSFGMAAPEPEEEEFRLYDFAAEFARMRSHRVTIELPEGPVDPFLRAISEMGGFSPEPEEPVNDEQSATDEQPSTNEN